ncbi:MAG: TolB family protein [Cytophagaceae bacterium]
MNKLKQLKGVLFSCFTTILFFLLLHQTALCQFTLSGQDPASVKWEQIHTENFQVIFPSDFSGEANRLVSILETVYLYAGQSLNHSPRKISVILHNQLSISNAFVTFAPYRAEFYTIPPQNLYPQDWLEQLAIHEFRHVVQIDKMRQGVTNIIYYLLGEQGVGAVLGAFLPAWFFEGDAVLAETVLTNSGRGRLPSFEMPLRAQVLEYGVYSYEKAFFGSFRDFIPDFYSTGYHLITMGRIKYGKAIWEDAINFSARKPYLIIPFSWAIRKHSGLNKWRYYRHSLKELHSLWLSQAMALETSEFVKVNDSQKKVYTSYRFPQFLNDSVIVAEKSGLSHIQQFVALHQDGSEEHVFTGGFYSSARISAKANKITWSEYTFDKRWQNRVWQDVFIYDLEEKKRKRLTHKRFLQSPAFSNDGKKIAAVEVLPDNSYYLVIIDPEATKQDTFFQHPEKYFLLTPTWVEDDEKIVYITLQKGGKGIEILDLNTSVAEELLAPGFEDISQPVVKDGFVYFHGTYSGIDNIYALNISDRSLFQVTSSLYGAFHPDVSADGKRMVYADYQADGYNVVVADINPSEWIAFHQIENTSLKIHEKVLTQEPGVIPLDTITEQHYESRKYSKWRNLINIHSWGPVSLDFSNNRVFSGVSVLSQNLLSTSVIDGGYRYNINEQAGSFYVNYSYLGWFPTIRLNSSIGNRRTFVQDENMQSDLLEWREKRIGGDIRVPLNLTRGKYRRGITPLIGSNFIVIDPLTSMPDEFPLDRVFVMRYQLSAFRYLKMALRDLRPKLGQSVFLNYRHSLEGFRQYGSVFSFNGDLFFPGILRHHSLKLSAAYVNHLPGSYNFINVVPAPRGYFMQFNDEFKGLYADYLMPLLYPDWRIGPLVYLKRINTGFFFDVAQGRIPERQVNYRSFGTEISFDVHFLNIPFASNIGTRVSYLPLEESFSYEMLFNLLF